MIKIFTMMRYSGENLKFITSLAVFLITSGFLFGQSAGDWRTRASGNWNATNVWQQYNGTSWVNVATYPSNRITKNITIRTHTITATDNIQEEDGATTTLTIESGGTLNMGGNYICQMQFLYGTLYLPLKAYNNIAVNGTLTTTNYVSAKTLTIGSTGYFRTSYSNVLTGYLWYVTAPTTTNINGTIEFSGTNHSIPNYTYNNMLVSGTATISSGSRTLTGDLTVSGTLTTAATLNIAGSLVNNGIISASGASTYNFNGASESISGSGTFPASNLSIGVGPSGTATLSISTASQINLNTLVVNADDALHIGATSKVTVTGAVTNSNSPTGITITSDASSSGSLIAAGATATGNITYERHIAGSQWHLMSSPVPGETIGAGFITKNSGSLSYKSASSEYAMAHYDEGGGGWSSFYQAGESGTLTAGQGFLGRIDSDGILSYEGALRTSTVNIGISNVNFGWNCIGNPFTSAIGITDAASTTPNDFLSVNSAQLNPSYAAIYIYDPANPAVYQIINNSGSGGGYINQDYILPGQGFLVKAKTGGGTASFTTAMQVHNATPDYYKKSASHDAWSCITLFVNCPDMESYTDIKFRSDMTTGLDITYDAGTFSSDPNLSLYTLLVAGGEDKFAIQCLPNEDGPDPMEIPIGTNCKKGGEIVFSAKGSNMLPYSSVILEDRLLHVFTDLQPEGVEYRVTVPEGTSGTGRFFLHAINAQSSDNATGALTEHIDEFRIYAAGKEIHINGLIEGMGQARIFDISGRQLRNFALEPAYSNILQAHDFNSGIYIVTVMDGDKNYSEKIFIN